MATIFLFDIDGTLISSSGAGRRAMKRAVEQIIGPRPELPPFDGMTDQQLVQRELAHLASESIARVMQEVFELYLQYLVHEVAVTEAERFRVHPGVEQVLAQALASGAALGLGTGNLREGARIKLERVGLFDRFAFGGFGCDACERADVLRHGAERGARALGVPLDECRVVVIGDTPKDVSAALAIGAECLGVGTGSYSPNELRAAGATWAVSNLAEPGATEALLGGPAT
jgi:phosphoglycolate phosphatase-like HAD superfamily hydrolase